MLKSAQLIAVNFMKDLFFHNYVNRLKCQASASRINSKINSIRAFPNLS